MGHYLKDEGNPTFSQDRLIVIYPRESEEHHENIRSRKLIYQIRIKLLRQKYYFYLN